MERNLYIERGKESDRVRVRYQNRERERGKE